MESVDIRNKIDNYIIDSYKLDTSKKYNIEYISARELVVPERIDLIAKIKYVESYDKKLDTEYFKELYRETIEAFSGATYVEPGNPNKNSFDKYLNTFNELIDDIKQNGIDPNKSIIPVGNNGAILDGAHRVSIAAYYNLDVPIIRFENANANFNIEFFKKNLLDTDYINYLMLEYAKIKNNIYVICLWPRCSKDNKNIAQSYIQKKLKVLYTSNINLNYNGLKNFMIQIYRKFDWIGTYKDNHKGALNKVDNCYIENEDIQIIIVESNDVNEVLKTKNEIREMLKVENHSIHSTDNKEETIEMLELVLNKNSISALNLYNPDKYAKFNKDLLEFKELLTKNNIPFNDVLIDSGAVMALYGLRQNDDIDILVNKQYNEILNKNNIDTHNSQIEYYNKTLDSLLYNPENYFVFNNLKFLTLSNLLIVKNNRNDKEDVILIKNKLNINGYKNSKKNIVILKGKIRKFKRKFKTNIIKFLKKIGCFELCLKLYKKIK